MQAEKILLVSSYQEYASCLNCKKKITELNTVKEIKYVACGTSQRREDCDIKVNIGIKLESHGDWLTLFENQWQPVWPGLKGSEEITRALLDVRNIKLKVDKNTRIVRNILETSTFMSEPKPLTDPEPSKQSEDPEPLTDPEPSKQNEQQQETVAISLETS